MFNSLDDPQKREELTSQPFPSPTRKLKESIIHMTMQSSLPIADYTTRRVLVDDGSSADILYYPAFQQMRLGQDLLRPACLPLIGFGGMKVQPIGTVTLPVVVGHTHNK